MLYDVLSNGKHATGKAQEDQVNSIYVNKSATPIIYRNKKF